MEESEKLFSPEQSLKKIVCTVVLRLNVGVFGLVIIKFAHPLSAVDVSLFFYKLL